MGLYIASRSLAYQSAGLFPRQSGQEQELADTEILLSRVPGLTMTPAMSGRTSKSSSYFASTEIPPEGMEGAEPALFPGNLGMKLGKQLREPELLDLRVEREALPPESAEHLGEVMPVVEDRVHPHRIALPQEFLVEVLRGKDELVREVVLMEDEGVEAGPLHDVQAPLDVAPLPHTGTVDLEAAQGKTVHNVTP